MFVQVTDPVRVYELLEAGLMWFKHPQSVHRWAYRSEEDADWGASDFIAAYARDMKTGSIYGYMTEE